LSVVRGGSRQKVRADPRRSWRPGDRNRAQGNECTGHEVRDQGRIDRRRQDGRQHDRIRHDGYRIHLRRTLIA